MSIFTNIDIDFIEKISYLVNIRTRFRGVLLGHFIFLEEPLPT